MKLTILGTGNAVVTRCYNTCFIFDDNGKYFLVDGGGGNGILRQLEDANIPWKEIRDIFITHKHLDHLTGIIWMIRMICQNMKRGTYEGEANLYGHAEVLQMAHDIACMVLQPKEAAYMGDRLHLITVENGETREIIGHDVTFFDIGSTKAKQFGFSMVSATAKNSPAAATNLITPAKNHTPTEANGCSTKPSACTAMPTVLNRMKNTILPSKTLANWHRHSVLKI